MLPAFTMAPPFYLLCLLLLHLLFLTSAQTFKNITLGSSLSTFDKNPYWSSPSGDFAFGFLLAPGAKDLFLLAIWFAKVPEKTIIWTANKGSPVQRGSKVQFSSDGKLSLGAPNGTEIWKPEIMVDGQVSSAAMLNSGNFMLTKKDSAVIWESFRNPTDTLLPSQTLEFNGNLISRLRKDNYTPGRFKLNMQTDGNLVLYPIARPTEDIYHAYWATGTVGNGTQVTFNKSGYIYLALKDGGQKFLSSQLPDPTNDFYHRVTLDSDGVLRQYTYPKSSIAGNWSSAWSVPENICTSDLGQFGTGFCGFNSYCKREAKETTCLCAPGYVYTDSSDTYGGCKQNFPKQSCEPGRLTAGLGYEIREFENMDWPYNDYLVYKAVGLEWCKKTCLDDCQCAAAIYFKSDCWVKVLLTHGVLNSNFQGKALIKVGNSTSPKLLHPPDQFYRNKRGRDKLFILVSVFLGTSALVNFLLLLLISLFIYWSYQKKKSKVRPDANTSAFGMNLRSFTYKELEEATDGFKEELGQGAYSTVYKGNLPVKGSFIAVKKLEKVVREVDKEFQAEVSAIGRTNHRNLVQLLGFCDEGSNRLLVYEYMTNGSLADLLFGSSRSEWPVRIQILYGIARGLTYLHEDCSTQIIHCDVKPQNILVDDCFMAKISDFGLAKLLKSDQTRTQTGVRGTRGYVAPEWFKNVAITAKVDVYSFGIMLLEIICCRRNAVVQLGDEEIDILSDWAYECCLKRKFHLLVENDEDAKNDKRLERFVMVAIWCIQLDPSLRPTMKTVTQMLEGVVAVSMPPSPSFFETLGGRFL